MEHASVLLEFLEACVLQVVYAMGVYPPEVFDRAQLYGIAVQRSRHPGITSYIHNSLESLR